MSQNTGKLGGQCRDWGRDLFCTVEVEAIGRIDCNNGNFDGVSISKLVGKLMQIVTSPCTASPPPPPTSIGSRVCHQVLAEYAARGGINEKSERLLAKFTHKLSHNPRVKLHKGNAKLVS